MNFHVLTLFPEMIEQGINTSITGRAIEKGLISLNAINIRDYAGNKHGQVDDYPYGGGAGMVMQPGPVYRSYESVTEKIGYKPRVIYLTPQGKVFNQSMAEEFSEEERLDFAFGDKNDEKIGFKRIDFLTQFANFGVTKLMEQIGETPIESMESIKNFLVSTVEGRNLEIDALPDDILLEEDY